MHSPHWTLQNVVFADGGTAAGSFDFDAETNQLNSFMIVTSPFSSSQGAYGASYAFGSVVPTFISGFVTPLDGNLDGELRFYGDLDGAITNAGGTVLFNVTGTPPAGASEILCVNALCNLGFPRRIVSGGVAAPVAETPSPAHFRCSLPASAASVC